MDEKELEFIEALRSLKVPRTVAALITYLANTNEATSREIEVGTTLRQPIALHFVIRVLLVHEMTWFYHKRETQNVVDPYWPPTAERWRGAD